MKVFLLLALGLTFISCIFCNLNAENITITDKNPILLVNSTPKDCPAIGYFSGGNSQGLGKVIKNYSGYCSNLEKTCCGIQDFKILENWWQEPTEKISFSKNPIYMSRSDIRTQKQQNVFLFTKEILKRTDSLIEFAQNVLDNKESDEFCKNSAKRVLRYEIPANLLKKFTKESELCWDFINELQISLMCSACDFKAQEFLKFETSE